MSEINSNNFSVKQKLQHLGNKFINGTEISAQEASYNILGPHMSESSHGEIFVNTSHPDQRVRMMKSKRDLERLPPFSTDIYIPSMIDHGKT